MRCSFMPIDSSLYFLLTIGNWNISAILCTRESFPGKIMINLFQKFLCLL